MADPLSITASIIAIVSAAEGVSSAISRLKTLYDAPAEALALINELSDLGVVLSQVEKHIVQNNQEQETQRSREQLQSLAALVESATVVLHDVHELVQTRLLVPQSTLHRRSVSQYGWL